MNLKADLWAIAALAALGAFVAWQAVRIGDLAVDRERLEAAAAAGARGARGGGDIEYRVPVQAVQEFVERPLFWESRRPPEPVEEEAPPPAPAAPPPPPPRGLTVTGVVQLGDEWRVLITRQHPPETLRLRQGETIDGWEVKAITPQRVTLGYGASSLDMPLYDPPVAPAPVAAPAKRPEARSAGASRPVQSGQRTPAQPAPSARQDENGEAAQNAN